MEVEFCGYVTFLGVSAGVLVLAWIYQEWFC